MEIAEGLERYRYDPESGRLRQREPGGAYDYDAGGRATEDGRWRYRYGAHGRLAEITRATTGERRAAYRYNALGERARKLGTSVTYYHYDLEGRLLAETDASGQTRAEYLYLGHAPLALSRSGQLYYYHNDHLGTPQKLTDGTGQVVWSASYRPFGEASIGVGYVTQNLRFPGQYYDEESGLHYNYHRYYDPDTGRYLTSDPIGLAGGMNTYLYAEANPLRFVDPTGEAAIAIPLIPPAVEGLKWCAATLSFIAITAICGDGNGCFGGDDDDDDFCYQRWEREDSACWQWKGLGARVIKACQSRAATRRDLCIRNGGRPDPSEPPEYNPFVDYPRYAIALVEESTDMQVREVVDDDGNVVEKGHYKGDVLHGGRTLWSPDGVKLGEAEYLNGKLHGKCLLWNEKGQKTLEAYFEKGKHHGPYTSWWSNGNKKEEGVYENGERVGKYYWHSEDGDLLSEHDYSK